MNGIAIGQFYPGSSYIHRMDPRAKIGFTFALIVMIFAAKGAAAYALILAFVLGAARISGIDMRIMLRGLKPILFIIVFTFVVNVLFSAGGTILFQWSFITVTQEGLLTAIYMAVRLALLVFASQLMTLTTSPIALTDGLESIMRPLAKIHFPAHEMAMMMSIALRFIPTLLEETDKIMKAQKARGADFESGNLLARAKSMLPLLVPLFVSAFRRADELALAMESRCYRGGTGRTRMKTLTFTSIDGAALGIFAVLSLLVAACTIWLS